MEARIRTKFRGATDFKGSHIVATWQRRRLSMPYQHELDVFENHARCAAMLAKKLKLTGFYWLAEANTSGYVFTTEEGVSKREAFRVGSASSAIPYSYTLFKGY